VEIIIASLSHMSATPRSKSAPYSLLTLPRPTVASTDVGNNYMFLQYNVSSSPAISPNRV
jgi:hypothetical protein